MGSEGVVVCVDVHHYVTVMHRSTRASYALCVVYAWSPYVQVQGLLPTL